MSSTIARRLLHLRAPELVFFFLAQPLRKAQLRSALACRTMKLSASAPTACRSEA